jgi:hypothetical protein
VTDGPQGSPPRAGTAAPRHGRKGRGGLAAAAVVLGLAVAGTVGVLATSTLGARSPGPGAQVVTDAPTDDVSDVVQRLESAGFQVRSRITDDDGDCATHAYGMIQTFFEENRCFSMLRALLEVRDDRRNTILVAIAWAEMPDPALAERLKDMVDTNGTGNIRELSRQRGQYLDVGFSDAAYASAREGSTVVNAQAVAIDDGVDGAQLADVAERALR